MPIRLKLFLATVFWGATPTVGRILASYEAPYIVVGGRFLIASVVLLIFMKFRRAFLQISIKLWLKFFLLGLTGVLLHNGLMYEGLESVTASTASILLALIAIKITVIDSILSRSMPNWNIIAGVLLGFFGAIYVVTNGHPGRFLDIKVGKGEVLILLSGISWAIYSVIGRDLLKSYQPLLVTTYASVIGVALMMPFFLNSPTVTVEIFTNSQSVALISFLGIFGSALAFLWYYQAVALLGVVETAIYLNFVPIFGVLSAFIFLGESISRSFLVGGAIVLTGVILVTVRSDCVVFNK
jgi:drug/metabolite transporter (DMT)-like permease